MLVRKYISKTRKLFRILDVKRCNRTSRKADVGDIFLKIERCEVSIYIRSGI